MKLCFLYSGLTRTLNHSIAILSTLIPSHIEYDIAIHITSNDEDQIYLNRQIDLPTLQENSHIKYVLFDAPVQIPEQYQDIKHQNAYHQWYKIKRVFSILPNPEEYQYIIRIRPDLFLLETPESFLNLLKLLQPNILYLPNGFNIYDSRIQTNHESINDQFAIGSPNIMRQYTQLFDFFEFEFNICSEITLASYLKNHSIVIQRIPLSYKLVLSLCNVIAITGDSGVGKSTVANAINRIFKFDKKVMLETDRYHKWERGHDQWSKLTHLNPEANYLERMKEDAFNLKIGNDIFTVDYDHHTGKFTPLQKIEAKDNIVLCGLHTLYHKNLRDIVDLKVYIDTQESLKHLWKIQRDILHRGHSFERVLQSIQLRQTDYQTYILPQREFSDIIIQFYTDTKIELTEWATLVPDIKMNLLLKPTLFQQIQPRLINLPIQINSTDTGFICLKFEKELTQLYPYIQEQVDFLDKDDLLEGHYGMIQFIFIMILYENATPNRDTSYNHLESPNTNNNLLEKL
jgi:uridine kinase